MECTEDYSARDLELLVLKKYLMSEGAEMPPLVSRHFWTFLRW